MLSLKVTFLAGRFHATPWGRNVNEAEVEWPPSPWRILRALVASWKRCCPDLDSARMSRILHALTPPPVFLLPRASVGHTRHFMPSGVAGAWAPESRDRVFDPFIALSSEDCLSVVWRDADLPPDDCLLLQRVGSRLPYLGRAEAWCDARLATSAEEDEDRRRITLVDDNAPPFVCRAASGHDVRVPDTEPVPLLVPEPWDADAILGDEHPLLIDTTTMRQRKRLLQPAGARWVTYLRPRQALEPEVQSRRPRKVSVVHVARYALDAHVLPLVSDTVWVAEAMRDTVQSVYGALNNGSASPTLSGHDPAGGPAKDHGHARYIPLDEDGDRRLDHITVVSTNGFTPREQDALAEVAYLRVGKDRTKVRVIPLGMATLEKACMGRVRLCGRGLVWESVTPFVLSRHPKKRADWPEDQLRREARQLGLPELVSIERIERPERGPRWHEFRRWRRRGPAPATTSGFGFRLRFDEPVTGPLALGYGSHFGLGVFLPL